MCFHLCVHSNAPQPALLFSTVLVTYSQLWSENIEWEISEVNNSQVLSHVLF